MRTENDLPKIKPYVTDNGGVVILNGPFPKAQAERVAKLCEAAPELHAALRQLYADSKEFHDSPDDEVIRSGAHTNCGWCMAAAALKPKPEDY